MTSSVEHAANPLNWVGGWLKHLTLHAPWAAAGAILRRASSKRRRRIAAKAAEEEKQSKQAASVEDSKWSKEDIANLTKAIVKFPPGTSRRWGVIAEFIGMRNQKAERYLAAG